MRDSMLSRLEKIILPIDCLGCGEESDWLCHKCRRKLIISRPSICALCGKAGFLGLCARCRQATKLDGLISLYAYHQPIVQKIIQTAKYHKQFDALRFILNLNRRVIFRLLPADSWVVTYVPTSLEHLRERGFNPAEIAARELAINKYPIKECLKKINQTRPQATLERKERIKNLTGSIKSLKKAPSQIIICDDVVTTGSTLKESTKVLRRAGAKRVFAITIAHG